MVGQSASQLGFKCRGAFCCTALWRGNRTVYRFLAFGQKKHVLPSQRWKKKSISLSLAQQKTQVTSYDIRDVIIRVGDEKNAETHACIAAYFDPALLKILFSPLSPGYFTISGANGRPGTERSRLFFQRKNMADTLPSTLITNRDKKKGQGCVYILGSASRPRPRFSLSMRLAPKDTALPYDVRGLLTVVILSNLGVPFLLLLCVKTRRTNNDKSNPCRVNQRPYHAIHIYY